MRILTPSSNVSNVFIAARISARLVGGEQRRRLSRRVLPGLALVAVLAIACGGRAAGQIVEDGVGLRSNAMAFGTFGGENTNLPGYADNALGFDLGVSYQMRSLTGVEFRTTAYPYKATYLQMSYTGGYRVARRTIFGFPYTPFAYFGGGWARSQDRGLGKTTYPPMWAPCWQADLGLDRDYGSFSWRAVQASWRETYTPLHGLRTLGLSTGLVYHFRRER